MTYTWSPIEREQTACPATGEIYRIFTRVLTGIHSVVAPLVIAQESKDVADTWATSRRRRYGTPSLFVSREMAGLHSG